MSTQSKVMAGVAVVAAVGLGATLLKANNDKKAERQARREMRRQKKLAKLRAQAEKEAASNVVTLYFNDKDEVVERDEATKLKQEGQTLQKVVVNFGAEEDVTKIPKHIFGKEKTQNAKIFLQKYQDQKEIKKRHMELPELLDVSTYSTIEPRAANYYDKQGHKKKPEIEKIVLTKEKKIVLDMDP